MVCVFLTVITTHVVSFMPWTEVGQRENSATDMPFTHPRIIIQISEKSHKNKYMWIFFMYICFSGSIYLLIWKARSSFIKFCPGKVLHDHIFHKISPSHSQILWVSCPLEFLSLLNNFQLNYKLTCIVIGISYMFMSLILINFSMINGIKN